MQAAAAAYNVTICKVLASEQLQTDMGHTYGKHVMSDMLELVQVNTQGSIRSCFDAECMLCAQHTTAMTQYRV